MSLSGSASSNGSAPRPSLLATCFSSFDDNLTFVCYTCANLLLVAPLAAAVLRAAAGRRPPGSHGDVITCHLVAVEAVGVLGSVSYCVGVRGGWRLLAVAGCYAFYIPLCAQMSFHVLACAERYVAAVHPVAYLRVRRGGGHGGGWPRLGNALAWSVWLSSLAEVSLAATRRVDSIVVLYFAQLAVAVAAVSFCSGAVLRVVRRPRPGAAGGRAGPSRRRTVDTVAAVMAALLLRCLGSLVCTALYLRLRLSDRQLCTVVQVGYWFGLPSSLALPLLFLRKAWRLRR